MRRGGRREDVVQALDGFRIYYPNCAKTNAILLLTMLSNKHFAYSIGIFLSHLLPLLMGEGKDGGGHHGLSSPPPDSSPAVGGGTNFWLNWGNKGLWGIGGGARFALRSLLPPSLDGQEYIRQFFETWAFASSLLAIIAH